MIIKENLCKENYKFEVKKTKSDWESIEGELLSYQKYLTFNTSVKGVEYVS